MPFSCRAVDSKVSKIKNYRKKISAICFFIRKKPSKLRILKFEDLVPTSLGSGAIKTFQKCVTVTADYSKWPKSNFENYLGSG